MKVNGESAVITFDRNETAKYWTMKATFSDGNEFMWDNLNLFEIARLTLRFDGVAVEN